MNQQVPKNLSPNGLHAWLLNESPQPILVDVREEAELDIAPFPSPVIHLPLSQSVEWMETLDNQLPKSQQVVVICHSGLRSWNFGCWLIEQGWENVVWNLEGGIDSWSIYVDASVPRY